MKVLVTGATARHVGKLDPYGPEEDAAHKRRLVYHACPHIFVAAARLGGMTVDFRKVDPRESLKEYDRVCVFLGPLVDPQMTFVHGALAAMARRRDAIVFLDDWKVGTIASSFKRMAARERYYLWHSPFARARPLRDAAYLNGGIHQKIEDLVDEMSEGRWRRRVVVPLHAWGDPSVIAGCPESDERYWLDYTPGLVPPDDLGQVVRDAVRLQLKKRRWMLATLGTRESWVERQQLRWPVDRYGYGAVRLSQDDVMRRSARYAGSLAPKYPHAPASWWRPRFVYSAWTRTVVHCDPAEGIAKKAPELYGLRAREVEATSNAGLLDLAKSQFDFVMKQSWSMEELIFNVQGVLA